MKKSLMLCMTGVFAFLTGCGGGSDPSFSLGSVGDGFQQVQSSNTKIDILWVIDNSGSMRASQEDLRDNFNSFISDFLAQGYDFQMAITTSEAFLSTDSGTTVCDRTDYDDENSNGDTNDRINADCRLFHGGIMTQDTPDLANYFRDRITVGIFGSGDERMIQSSQSALEYSENNKLAITGETTTFIRPDSHLAIIMVSDEEDFSRASGSGSDRDNTDLFALTPGEKNSEGVDYISHSPGADSWETYFDNLTGTNSSAEIKNYSVSSIGIFDFDQTQITANGLNYVDGYNPDTRFGPTTSYDPNHSTSSDHTVCQAELKGISNSTQQPSLRMGRLADATGGVNSSLCGNFGQGLIDIANNIITLVTDYPLESTPIPETIIITIDDIVIEEADLNNPTPNGWSYNEASNSISFHGSAIPPQGSNITANYTPNGI